MIDDTMYTIYLNNMVILFQQNSFFTYKSSKILKWYMWNWKIEEVLYFIIGKLTQIPHS